MSSPIGSGSGSVSSSSARLQKLRQQRARSNAAKAAATSSVGVSPKAPFPTQVTPSVSTHAGASWIKSNDSTTQSKAAPNSQQSLWKSNSQTQRTRSNNMSNSSNKLDSDAEGVKRNLHEGASTAAAQRAPSSPSANGEWFRYTNGTTESKTKSNARTLKSSNKHVPKPINLEHKLSQSDGDSRLLSSSVHPQHESEKGFHSVKSRFESNLNKTQSASLSQNSSPAASAEPQKESNKDVQSIQARYQSNLNNSQSAAQSTPKSIHVSQATLPSHNKTNHTKSQNESKGFSYAKTRLETNSVCSSSTAGSVISGMKKSYHTTTSSGSLNESKSFSTKSNSWQNSLKSRQMQSNATTNDVSQRQNEVPWPTLHTADSSKPAVTSNSQNVESRGRPIALDKFLAMHETKKNAEPSIKTNGSSPIKNKIASNCSSTSLKGTNLFSSKNAGQSNSALYLVQSDNKVGSNETKQIPSNYSKSLTQTNNRFIPPAPAKIIHNSTPSKNAYQPNRSFVMPVPPTRPNSTPNYKDSYVTPGPVKRTLSIPLKSISSGAPVWIHASLFQESGAIHSDWEWVRAYMQDSSTSDTNITVIAADNGRSYTIPNQSDLILMGNFWWSNNNWEANPRIAPSPTSVAQFGDPLDEFVTNPMPPGDLVELTHLHEPAIVHALHARYEQDLIYTYTGGILLALNPFKKLDHLYTREIMELYFNGGGVGEGFGMDPSSEEESKDQQGVQKPPPHAYAVAERAFSCMLRSLEERDQCRSKNADLSPCDQSILVSGESGAGKTVTTKIIMRYLTILSQRRMIADNNESPENNDLSVEAQVLQSNPVLESFGNARTIRNDNSSRFGKFIEMRFCSNINNRGTLLGASIHFYLLEKVRVVNVNQGERNYHVFYEVLSSGMSVNEKKRFMLTDNFGRGSRPFTVNDFYMTSVSGTFGRRDGVKDCDTYEELRMAMDTVGFSSEEQDAMFCVVAALLHASNLRFMIERGSKSGSEDCVVYEQDGTLSAVASLLGVSDEALNQALTSSVIEARGERLTKRLSMEQAEKALEALNKATYAALFAFIVKRINESIEANRRDRGPEQTNNVATIGVLDIFGFESFETNSFEQLCINYCNEALQQQFNRYVFKAEKAEYEYEGIEWSNIQFTDNQEALDLIEDRRTGIFSVLDEQCRLQRCNDKSFVRAVYDKCKKNANFVASQMQKSEGTFAISHYAGQVEYNSDGFLVKNKDELPKGACELLASSNVPLVSELSTIVGGISSNSSSESGAHGTLKRSSSSFAQTSVSGQFSSQLRDLRSRIALTGPHYIRCLKPNDQLIADHFDEPLIAHQLNCAGVLPAMKLARAGYSMRYTHSSFILRYRVVVYRELPPKSKLTCQRLLSLLSKQLNAQMKKREDPALDNISDVVSWGVQIGRTKVFLRASAFDSLEALRTYTINSAAIKLQSQARAHLLRSHFLLTLGSILTLQCAMRKILATLYVFRLRWTCKAVIVQKCWRSYSAWSSFQNVLFIASWVQRYWRGNKVRERFSSFKEYYQQARDAAILVQCAFRVRMAKKSIYQLRREAKDLHLVAKERDQLRSEMKQMRLELEEMKRTQSGISGSSICVSHETLSRTSGIDHSVQSHTQEIKLLHQECAKKDRDIQYLREKVESLQSNRSTISSTLPTTVTFDNTLRSSRSHAQPSHCSALAKPSSSNLLDSELELLEYSRISHENSFEGTFEQDQLPSLHLSLESKTNNSIEACDFPLHHVIQCDDKVMFSHVISNSSNIDLEINATDLTGRTPLHVAVQCGNAELVQLILLHNIVVNTQDALSNTALHYTKSVEIAEMLLNSGCNPNIPNCDGLCALHLAVKRRDFSLVKCLLSHGADVTNADDVCWFTPLHFIAQVDTSSEPTALSVRGPIAELLCESKHPSPPDLNYQDRDGNTPLHHAASLAEEDSGILISVFIEHGSRPTIVNNRGQTPIHLFCHNNAVRQYAFYHEVLLLMLENSSNPNQQSLSGCTPLHLSLYHGDLKSAALLTRYGAELNAEWKKPHTWNAFWTDMESDVVLPLDMIEDFKSLHSIIAEISTLQNPAPHRSKCMHCKMKFRMLSRKQNCSHCGRSICGRCSTSLQATFLPHLTHNKSGRNVVGALVKVCVLCEAMLLSKGGSSTVPSSIVHDENASELSIGTISM